MGNTRRSWNHSRGVDIMSFAGTKFVLNGKLFELTGKFHFENGQGQAEALGFSPVKIILVDMKRLSHMFKRA